MEVLWARGDSSIREICDRLAESGGGRAPAYTTIQTTVYRMETKKILRRVGRASNSHVFATQITRDAARGTLVDDLLGFFGGKGMPLVAQLIASGKLTLEDVQKAEEILRHPAKGEEGKQ